MIACFRFELRLLDFVSNNNPPSFPEGLDTEVFTFKALSKAYSVAKKKFDREHVTQFFYKNPKIFKQINFTHKKSLQHHRWTIDTFDDKINRFIIQTAGYKGVHMVASFLNISVATDRQTSDFII